MNLIQAVSPLDEATLQQGLAQLVDAELLYQRGHPPQAQYLFKHALIQDAAYQSLLKSTRQQYHQRIAQVLEAQFPEIVETQPELVAHHYTEAGLSGAGHSLLAAGWPARRRALGPCGSDQRTSPRAGAAQDAAGHAGAQPARTDVAHRPGASLIATKGHAAPEVATNLCPRPAALSAPGRPPAALPGAARPVELLSRTAPSCRRRTTLGEQLLTLAQQAQDPAHARGAHRASGPTLFYLGEPASAHTHLAQGMALYDPQQHRALTFLYGEDAGVVCRSHAAWTLWCLGYPDQGLARNDEAVTLAQQSAHPFSLAFALSHAALFHQLRREARATQERAEAAISLATEQGFPFWMAIRLYPAWLGAGAAGTGTGGHGADAARA